MEYTSQYKLLKPDKTDFYNIEHFNENTDKIEEVLKKMEDIQENGFLKAKIYFEGDFNEYHTMEQIVRFKRDLCSNTPPGMGEYGGMIVLGYTENTQQQIVIDGQRHHIYTRLYVAWSGSPWSEWQEIWHSGNDGAGSGLDADMVDGKHAADLQNYDNLTNKPNLKTVATSGSYNDLENKPTIPTTLPANGGNADTVDGKHAADFETPNGVQEKINLAMSSVKEELSGVAQETTLQTVKANTNSTNTEIGTDRYSVPIGDNSGIPWNSTIHQKLNQLMNFVGSTKIETESSLFGRLKKIKDSTARGVLKSVQRGVGRIPENGNNAVITIAAVTPGKCIVLLDGAIGYIPYNSSRISVKTPYLVSLDSTTITVGGDSAEAYTFSWQIIEFY